jgi:fused signal recognition particle receptor
MAFRWFKKNRKESEKSHSDAPPPLEPETPEVIGPEKSGFFKQLKKGLSKTREILTTDIDELFTAKQTIDDEFLEELEELLITSDLGIQTTMELMAGISKKASAITNADDLKSALKEEIVIQLNGYEKKSEKSFIKPHVILVLGVNGVGKTTTIGKLAAKYTAAGKKVLIAAADTFRAAAIEQLTIWAERADADIVKHKEKADPSAVVFDCIDAALARDVDIVLIDTAGRLHTQVNLMEELKKIKRTISKKLPGAPHEILMVLDATTGQNALSQAKLFNDALGVTGIALTKLDGTAKGGIVVSICSSLNIPLEYIGVGEKIEDLQEFDPKRFVDAIF